MALSSHLARRLRLGLASRPAGARPAATSAHGGAGLIPSLSRPRQTWPAAPRRPLRPCPPCLSRRNRLTTVNRLCNIGARRRRGNTAAVARPTRRPRRGAKAPFRPTSSPGPIHGGHGHQARRRELEWAPTASDSVHSRENTDWRRHIRWGLTYLGGGSSLRVVSDCPCQWCHRVSICRSATDQGWPRRAEALRRASRLAPRTERSASAPRRLEAPRA